MGEPSNQPPRYETRFRQGDKKASLAVYQNLLKSRNVKNEDVTPAALHLYIWTGAARPSFFARLGPGAARKSAGCRQDKREDGGR